MGICIASIFKKHQVLHIRDPFIEEWCLETKIWVVSVLIATGDSLLLGLFSVQSLVIYYVY